MQLTREQIERFHTEGYLYLGPVLSPAELKCAQAAYDRIMGLEDKPTTYKDLGQSDDEATPSRSVIQVLDMWRLDGAFHSIVSKSSLLDIIEALMGTPNIRLFHDQALYKIAKRGDEVPWHQDNGYWSMEPAAAISCWLALDDVNETNGCMRMIPGSHLNGAAEHHQAGGKGGSVVLQETAVDDSLAVPVPMPAGCAMVHHCQTLHNTQPNTSPRERRAFAIHYMPADCRVQGELRPDNLLLRGEPLVQSVKDYQGGEATRHDA
jgi:ectoine hydroxylase-related dioxygenase (phytanoyl-CoA dioxygenase family)